MFVTAQSIETVCTDLPLIYWTLFVTAENTQIYQLLQRIVFYSTMVPIYDKRQKCSDFSIRDGQKNIHFLAEMLRTGHQPYIP